MSKGKGKVILRDPRATTVYLQMKRPKSIIRGLGLGVDGDVQRFHTANVLKRIKRYMPFQSGYLYKLTVAQTIVSRPVIITQAPQAEYLFEGKKMVNAKTGKGPGVIPGIGPRYRKGTVLKRTETPLEYFKGKNPNAGPRWDQALSAAEGKAMAADIQRYLARRKSR